MNEVDIIKILLVESDFASAKLIQVFLNSSEIEFNLTHAPSLYECVKKINNDNYDVVLLDLDLDDSRGIKTLERVLQESPNASIVVLIGSADLQVGKDAIQKGAQDFIDVSHLDSYMIAKTILYAVNQKKLQIKLNKSNQMLKEAQELGIILMQMQNQTNSKTDKPPIFSSWKTLYWIVIATHIVLITLFTLLTKAYS